MLLPLLEVADDYCDEAPILLHKIAKFTFQFYFLIYTIKERHLHSLATSSFMFQQSSGYSSYICISTYLKAILIL